MSETFTYTWLTSQLKYLQSNVGLYSFESTPESGVLLRHDVDFDVVPARELAKIESNLGLQGTFFFLTTAETYNPSSRSNRKMIQEISALGFEVALHFDSSVYETNDVDKLTKEARHEASVLEEIVGRPVMSLSLHNPSVTGQYPKIDGFINAYEPKFFSQDRYLSDSRMKYHMDPVQFFSNSSLSLGQLLLHPMHYSPEGDRYPMQMINHLHRSAQSIHNSLLVNSEYRRMVPLEPNFNFASIYEEKTN